MAAASDELSDAVQRYSLEPHPEGGFFRRFYTGPALGPGSPPRAAASSILYLLPRGCTSSLHSLSSDELWLYQAGAVLTVVQVHDSGEVVETPVEPGAPLVVRAGALFGAYCAGEERSAANGYALVCCVVCPGFVWEDFSMPAQAELLRKFEGKPEAVAAVKRLGKSA